MTEIEKQEIEEMAGIIKFVQDSQVFHDGEADRKQIATALHNAGYRLEREVVKEFVKKCGKDFAILLDAWGNEAQRNALDKAWKTINEVAEQYRAGEDK